MEELGCEGGVSPPLFFADDEEGGPASDEDEVSNASQLHEPAQLDAAATRPPLDGQWHAGGASSNAVAQPGRQMNRGILRAAVPVDYNTVFTNAKAGMDDVDKEYVKKVVFEMSKDSSFFKNQQRMSHAGTQRIAKMKEQIAALTPSEVLQGERWADSVMARLEEQRDLSRTYIHVDMDMFFAAVETLIDPSIRDVPFAVGGLSMISTANYVARKYGVRSAMPGFIGKHLCAHPAPGSLLPPAELCFVGHGFARYTLVSQQCKAIFKGFDPHLQPAGIDEAYLDVTDYMAAHNISAREVGERIRRVVREAEYDVGEGRRARGLTCSCGIAPNRRVAKICSDINKPDGQYIVPASCQALLDFVSTLPLRKVPFIGRVTERMLADCFGVALCGEVFAARGAIARVMSPQSAEFMLSVALGAGDTTPHEDRDREGHARKGISTERTFRPLHAPDQLEQKCRAIARCLAEDMAREGLRGKTLTLKLKPVTFETFTRALTLASHIHTEEQILSAALPLLRREYPLHIRLMGLRMSSLLKEDGHGGRVSTVPRPLNQPTVETLFGKAAGGQGPASRRSAAAPKRPAPGRPDDPFAALEAGGALLDGLACEEWSDETCPLSTGGRTRRVQLVQGEGGGGFEEWSREGATPGRGGHAVRPEGRGNTLITAWLGRGAGAGAQEARSRGGADASKLAALGQMGFEACAAARALQTAGGRLEGAIEVLLGAESGAQSGGKRRRGDGGTIVELFKRAAGGTQPR